MITFIGKRNASEAEDRQALGIALEVIDRANRSRRGHPRRRGKARTSRLVPGACT